MGFRIRILLIFMGSIALALPSMSLAGWNSIPEGDIEAVDALFALPERNSAWNALDLVRLHPKVYSKLQNNSVLREFVQNLNPEEIDSPWAGQPLLNELLGNTRDELADIGHITEGYGKTLPKPLRRIFLLSKKMIDGWDHYVEYRMIEFLWELSILEVGGRDSQDPFYYLIGRFKHLGTLPPEIMTLLKAYEAAKPKPIVVQRGDLKDSAFQGFPGEMLLNLMKYLDDGDLRSASEVSRRFYELGRMIEHRRAVENFSNCKDIEKTNDPFAEKFPYHFHELKKHYSCRLGVLAKAEASLQEYAQKYHLEHVFLGDQELKPILLLMWMTAETEMQKIAVLRNIKTIVKTTSDMLTGAAWTLQADHIEEMKLKTLTIYRQGFESRFNFGFQPVINFEFRPPPVPCVLQ